MAGITNDGSRWGELYVARDIVASMVQAGPVRCHGSIRCVGWERSQEWRSELSQVETESILRAALRSEGRRLVAYVTQAED